MTRYCNLTSIGLVACAIVAVLAMGCSQESNAKTDGKTKSTGPKTVEAKDTKPTELKAAEAKPAELKPVETKTVETKTAETRVAAVVTPTKTAPVSNKVVLGDPALTS